MSEKARAELFARARRHKGLQIILRPNQIAKPSSQTVSWIYHGACTKRGSQTLHARYVILQTRVVIDIQQAEGILTIVVPGKRLFSSTTYIYLMVGTSLVLFAVASIFMRKLSTDPALSPRRTPSEGRRNESGLPNTRRIGGPAAATAFNRMRERINRQI